MAENNGLVMRCARVALSLLYSYAVRFLPCREAHGIRIIVARFGTDVQEQLVNKVASALSYIERYDPSRSARIRRDLNAILIWVATPGTVAFYEEQHGLCVLNAKHVRQNHAIQIALLIVHEATHARLQCFEFTEPKRGRIEQICKRAEIQFAARLPGSEDLQSILATELAAIDVSALTDEAIFQRGQHDLRLAGVPEWFLRFVSRRRGFSDKRS